VAIAGVINEEMAVAKKSAENISGARWRRKHRKLAAQA